LISAAQESCIRYLLIEEKVGTWKRNWKRREERERDGGTEAV
jgi:hypothetical protein